MSNFFKLSEYVLYFRFRYFPWFCLWQRPSFEYCACLASYRYLPGLGLGSGGEYHTIPRPGPKPCNFFIQQTISRRCRKQKNIKNSATRKCSVTELGWIIIRYFRKFIVVRPPPQRPAFMGQTYCCQATAKLFLTRQGYTSRDASRTEQMAFVLSMIRLWLS